MRRSLVTLMSIALFSSLPACSTAEPPRISAADATATGGYMLGPGDKLRVTVFNELNLTGEYSVTSGGTVSFPLIGPVPAADHTIDQLAQAITARLAEGYVRDPRVSVEVLNYRPYYILGEVSRPGEYPYVNGMTLEQAVAAAGGFTYRAKRKAVYLRRTGGEERTASLQGASVYVKPGDTIRVGERYF